MKSIPGVADNLAVANKAFQVKDNVTGEAAVAAARSAYGAWVQAGASGAATVGDWLAVKTAAIQLDVVKSQVFAQARAQARSLVDLKTAEQADPCTVTKNDFDCWVKMLATVQMVGAEASDQLAGARKLGKAIEDRVQNKAPDGCEEWTFQMTLTDRFPSGSVWTIQYPTGSFRVSHEAGTLDGTYEAGLVAGGNIGLIGSATDECIETTPDGTTDLGPVTIQSSTFHYTFSGSADASSIEVTASSDDADIAITVPGDPTCQFLGDLARGVLDSIVRSGVPLEFATTPTQQTSTFQYDDGEGATIFAQIKRKPLKKP